MTDPTCTWDNCQRPARISVSVGQSSCGASRHGGYCVPHSALASRALHVGLAPDAGVWLDWLRAVADPLVDVDCTCVPARWSATSRRDIDHHALRGDRRKRAGRHTRGGPQMRGELQAPDHESVVDEDAVGTHVDDADPYEHAT